MIFGVNFKGFLSSILPYFMRTTVFVAWKDVVGEVMNQVNASFTAFITTTTDTTNITGQKISLEKYLNDLYDPVLKRIYIENQQKPGYFFIRNKVEQRPALILYNKSESQLSPFLNQKSELFGTFEYIIFIPVAITFDTDVLRKQVNFYNPAGRRYDIQTF